MNRRRTSSLAAANAGYIAMDKIANILAEAIDTDLTREQVIGKVKEAYKLALAACVDLHKAHKAYNPVAVSEAS